MNDYCFVSWNITEICNFRCAYCGCGNASGLRKKLRLAKTGIIGILQGVGKYDLHNELDHIIARFLATGKAITFGFTGGEPFLLPGFVDILKQFAAHDTFKIALDTNLSVDLGRFVESVPPRKVEYIYTSLHILERERFDNGVEKFLTRVRRLLDAGYPVISNYVLYPPLIERFESDWAFCLSRGVQVLPKPFKGSYEGRVYPDAYTDEQRTMILKYDHACNARTTREIPNYRGRLCNAGKSLVRIDTLGNVTRCVADTTSLGNIYTGFKLFEQAQPCVVSRCPCFSPDRLFGVGGEERVL